MGNNEQRNKHEIFPRIDGIPDDDDECSFEGIHYFFSAIEEGTGDSVADWCLEDLMDFKKELDDQLIIFDKMLAWRERYIEKRKKSREERSKQTLPIKTDKNQA